LLNYLAHIHQHEFYYHCYHLPKFPQYIQEEQTLLYLFEYNQPFEPGDRIAINSGFMELTYRNGVRLVLQGPVDYTLVDADRGRLELGSLAAEVPPEVSGFTVVTPSAEVKDIGTRFAVALLDTGRTELEVFEGEVQAKSAMTGSVFKSFKTGEKAAIDMAAAVPLVAFESFTKLIGPIVATVCRRCGNPAKLDMP